MDETICKIISIIGVFTNYQVVLRFVSFFQCVNIFKAEYWIIGVREIFADAVQTYIPKLICNISQADLGKISQDIIPLFAYSQNAILTFDSCLV